MMEGSVKNTVISYIVITFGLMLYTFAWSAFLLPSQIVAGGVTGLSSIIYYAAGLKVPIGVLNLVFNGILLAIGFKVLGSQFGFKTIYAIAMISVLFILWQQILHVDTIFDVSNFGGFMCAVIGGALCGVGIGLAFIMGGNTGGTDIIALIVSRYHNISPGRVILLIDVLIIGCSYFVSYQINNVVYGYAVMIVMTYILDLVVDGNKQTYQIIVFSVRNYEIGEAITQEVGRGATLIEAEGCYSHNKQKVLMVMVHRTDKAQVMKIIQRIDEGAFFSVSKAQGVYGKNFEKLKL